MDLRFTAISLICLFAKVQQTLAYNVSVVEYDYQYVQGLSPQENLMRNVAAHVNIIRYLKRKSDLVVFPEGSLCPSHGPNAVYTPLPPPSFSSVNITNKGIQKIVDAAKSSNIYVVINIPERYKTKRYSTSIVFRKNGTVAARYRKYHLTENDIDRPDSPELSYFQTDMGDSFGLFTSHDILYQSPALDLVSKGIRNFIHQTSWSSRLPYLTGNQIQQSWSWSQDVTLLAAGINNIETGRTGSGIYTGRKGHLTRTPIRYYMASTAATLVITGSLQPIHSSSFARENYDRHFNLRNMAILNKNDYDRSIPQDVQLVKVGSSQLNLASMTLKHYDTILISPDGNCVQKFTQDGQELYRCRQQKQVCSGKLCCQFDVTVDYFVCQSPCTADLISQYSAPADSFHLFRYRMAAMDGVDNPWNNGETVGLQVCSVISCLDTSIESCGKKPDLNKYKTTVFTFQGMTKKIWAESVSVVDIKGNFTNNSSTSMMPNILLGETELTEATRFGLLTNNFMFQSGSAHLSMPDQIRNLGTAAVVNRIFSRDGFPSSGCRSTNSSNKIISLFTLIYILYRSINNY